MTNLEEIYRHVARQFSLPWQTVEEVYRAQLRFTRQKLEGDEFPAVRWGYMGVFKPMPDRLERYKKSKHWDPETQQTIKQ